MSDRYTLQLVLQKKVGYYRPTWWMPQPWKPWWTNYYGSTNKSELLLCLPTHINATCCFVVVRTSKPIPQFVCVVLAQSYPASLLKLHAQLQMLPVFFKTDFASLIVANSSNYIICVSLLMYSVFFLLIVYSLYYVTYYGGNK